jgi:DMSO reductase family type II enzyme iron-sulfur subunit
MCNHCAKPACLEACPNEAIYKREQDGLVVIHQEKCKGAQACIQSCPYAKPYFNAQVNKANKCIGCFPRIEKGVAPACVAQCAGRAMHVGFIDDQESSVFKLVKRFGVALPLHPEYGTEPNVFYVPPVLGPRVEMPNGEHTADPKISMTQLEQLFGKQVREVLKTLQAEREKKIKNQPSELMDILIGRRSADMMISPMT